MTIARAIRAGVGVAHRVLDRNDMLVDVHLSRVTGKDDRGQDVFGEPTTYKALVGEDVRRYRPGARRRDDAAMTPVLIMQAVEAKRGDRVSSTDGTRFVEKISQFRDGSGVYMTEIMLI